VLRSIPNKLGGLIGFAIAIIILGALSQVSSLLALNQFFFYNYVAWGFLVRNLILMWLGRQAVEDPYITIGQCTAVLYFFLIFLILYIDTVFRLSLIV
jgi:hypothetical protein